MDNMTPNPNAVPTESTPTSSKIDDKAVKKIAGDAIMRVDGVLSLEGGLADLLKNDTDVTKGIAVSMSDDNKAAISVKIVTEYGKNIPQIVDSVTASITRTLQAMAGITAQPIQVEVTDTMTRDEFQKKTQKGRGLQ